MSTHNNKLIITVLVLMILYLVRVNGQMLQQIPPAIVNNYTMATKLEKKTVAELSSLCIPANEGQMYLVSNGGSLVLLGGLLTIGSAEYPVWCDGTNWRR